MFSRKCDTDKDAIQDIAIYESAYIWVYLLNAMILHAKLGEL